jgi:hypothetical protein
MAWSRSARRGRRRAGRYRWPMSCSMKWIWRWNAGAIASCAMPTDANVYVRSRRTGERVMALLRRLYGKLHLTVNETKAQWPACLVASSLATAFG